MVEKKIEKKAEKDMTKDEYFKLKENEARQSQVSAAIKGWFILAVVFIVECLIYSFLRPTGLFTLIVLLVGIIIFCAVFFLMMYFVWGPQDIFFASFPREGYTKAKLLGNELAGFIGCPSGKAFTKDWDVVDIDNPEVCEENKDLNLWGMHIFFWPFVKIYWEKTEWQRWYPTEKIATLRRELLREFTLLPYPFYIETVDAEDANRLKITIKTNVVIRIINPKKALFKQATTWIDLVRPIIQGGYLTYIKANTFQQMLISDKDIGSELLDQMKDPTGQYGSLRKMLKEVYGVCIESISVIDISGSDEEEQKAINAKAVAKLNRDADLIKAGTKAQSGAIDTIGKIIKMLAQMVAETTSIGKDEDQQSRWDEAENMLKKMIRENPEEFEKLYGRQFKTCLDILQRQMALEKGKFVDIRSPDAKGNTGDLLSIIMSSKLIDAGNSGGKSSTDEEKKEGKKKKEDLPFPGYEF